MAKTATVIGIQVCVFDAYGTLFDVNSAAQQLKEVLGDRWQLLAERWRAKQLQYTWLRTLMGCHADFWHVTGDALDYAMASVELDDRELREKLMDLYLRLSPYPEVKETLARLKAGGQKLAILSNGSPEMLQAAVEGAQLSGLLDAVLSVEKVGRYKPHPAVYQMALDAFGCERAQICFLSSNGWDAYAAKAFGFHVFWCNRFGQPRERVPETPDAEITTLSALPGLIGIS